MHASHFIPSHTPQGLFKLDGEVKDDTGQQGARTFSLVGLIPCVFYHDLGRALPSVFDVYRDLFILTLRFSSLELEKNTAQGGIRTASNLQL